MEVRVFRVEAGGEKIFNSANYLRIELAVVDGGSKGMKVGNKHVDFIIAGVFAGEVDHWKVGTEKIAESRFFVGADAGKNCGACHALILVEMW